MKKLLLAFALLSPLPAIAQQYSIDWYKIAGGGGKSTGGVYSLTGTIGQADAGGESSGGKNRFTGGFWAIQTPGAPALTIAPAGAGQATISWVPNQPGWILQESPSLTSPAWTNTPGPQTNPMTVPTPGSIKFFRLAKP